MIDVPQAELSSWMDRQAPTKSGLKPVAGLRLLVGRHIHRSEPDPNEKDLMAMREAMGYLSKSFEIPDVQFLRDTHNFPRFWSLPRSLGQVSESSASYYLRVSEFSAAWHIDPKTQTTQAVLLFYRHAWKRGRMRLKNFLSRARGLVDQIDFLPFVLCNTALSLESETMEELAGESHGVDTWISLLVRRHRQSDDVDYATKTASLTSDSRLVSSCQKSLRTLLELPRFFVRNGTHLMRNIPDAQASEPVQEDATLQEGMYCLQQAVSSLLVEADWRQERITRHLSTILSLIAQRDQYISIATAEASKTIALESRRDNSSMKTIAAIQMAFLPGTFVASFFAMPFFEWKTANSSVDPKLWIFWVTTIPLTLMVFAIWYAWYMWKRERERVENKEVLGNGDGGGGGLAVPEKPDRKDVEADGLARHMTTPA